MGIKLSLQVRTPGAPPASLHRPLPAGPFAGRVQLGTAATCASSSRNKLDTEQMAMIKETFMSTMGPSLTPVSWGSGCPAWALSTRETLTVAVADSAGSPWSFTTITRLCILPSASSKGRVVRISPLYRPTRKGTAGLLGSCSS
uniref:Uncharacterized protein n=1 Tax=Sphenodon punctatus TaxID=8508 RepID=A0A8D0HPE1_SPHPU